MKGLTLISESDIKSFVLYIDGKEFIVTRKHIKGFSPDYELSYIIKADERKKIMEEVLKYDKSYL